MAERAGQSVIPPLLRRAREQQAVRRGFLAAHLEESGSGEALADTVGTAGSSGADRAHGCTEIAFRERRLEHPEVHRGLSWVEPRRVGENGPGLEIVR